MSDDTIKRPEFTYFQRTMQDSLLSIKDSMSAIAESSEKHSQESTKQNQILKEYIITNEHRHQKTDDRLTIFADELTMVKEAFEATKQVNDFWAFVGKWVRYVFIGGLTAYGAVLAHNYLNPNVDTKPPVKVHKVP